MPNKEVDVAERKQGTRQAVTTGRRRRPRDEGHDAPAGPDVGFDPFTRLRVLDAMHPGLISCPPDTALRTVARMMATYRVHAILVTPFGRDRLADGSPWGVISDSDVLRAAEGADTAEQTARAAAATPAVTVSVDDGLAHAARIMRDRGLSHLVVTDPHSAKPIGVLSTLDLMRALAGFPERHPVVF